MGFGEPFRVAPLAPVQGYRSFGMRVTKRVQATCEEFGCDGWAKGWRTTVLPDSEDEGVIVAACEGRIDGLRRRWSTVHTDLEGFRCYDFPPGQPCFKASVHAVPWDFAFHHRDGDWRGNPTGLVVAHPDGTSWRDEFGQHQERIAHQRQRYGAE